MGPVRATPGEQSVLERIAQRDPGAPRALLDRYGNLVWSLVRPTVRSDGDAEEIVHEVFVRLWSRADRFDPALGEEATFVSVVTRRLLIDRWRKVGRPGSVSGAVALDASLYQPWGGVGEQASARAERGEDFQRAMRTIEALPEEQRRALTLAVAHGLTHEEIARALKQPLGTIKTHIRRGLQAVRSRLGGVHTPTGHGAKEAGR